VEKVHVKRVPNVVRTKEIMDDIIEIYRKDPKQEDVEDLNFNSEEDA